MRYIRREVLEKMNMLVIMSHELNNNQTKEAREKLNVVNIKNMPENIKYIWGNISPKGSLPIKDIDKIIEWIEEESDEGDYVLVQGDFGSTHYIVSYCFAKERIPIYATSYRIVEE